MAKALKKINLSILNRVVAVLIVVLLTYVYSTFQKSNFDKFQKSWQSNVILREMPSFEVLDIKTNKLINKEGLRNESFNVLMIHFWGTWCLPCEQEFPPLLKLAKEFESNPKVKFLFVAIRDNEKLIKKFLSKFEQVPKNVIVALANNDDIITKFGTVKVPETYLFNSQFLTKHKLIGPQRWDDAHYHELLLEMTKEK